MKTGAIIEYFPHGIFLIHFLTIFVHEILDNLILNEFKNAQYLYQLFSDTSATMLS